MHFTILSFLVVAFVIYAITQTILDTPKRRKEREAFDLHCDMWEKIQELLDDPTISDTKWKEWLPIFDEVDRYCEKNYPGITDRLGSLATRVKHLTSDNRD